MLYEHPLSFYALSLVAVVILLAGLATVINLWRQGQAPPSAQWTTQGLLKTLLFKVLFQVQILRRSWLRWIMHMAIFWGILALFAQTAFLTLLQWVIPRSTSFSQYFFQGPGRLALDFWGDFWGLVLLVGLIIALVRRYLVRPPQLETLFDDAIALWLLVLVVVSGFVTEAVRLALASPMDGGGLSFIGRPLANLIGTLGASDPMTWFWIHGVTALVAIAYIPFGKFIHILTVPVELAFSDEEDREREGRERAYGT